MGKFKRAFVIVLDSYGIGNEPDAADFGDGVCNTLKSIVASDKYDTPNMKKLGLFNIDGVGCGEPVEKPLGSFARLRELSRGKDTTGVGLGLSIVSRIVSLHAGQIAVKSVKGEYTEFVVTLPRYQRIGDDKPKGGGNA